MKPQGLDWFLNIFKNTGNVGGNHLNKEMMKEFLRRGESVLWNATNVTEQQRSSLIDIALQYDSKIEIVFMNTDLNDVINQNRNRESKVPEDVIINLSRKMEIPRLHECHKLKVI